MVGLDERLVPGEVRNEIVVSRFLRIEVEVRVGVIADQVAGLVPLA